MRKVIWVDSDVHKEIKLMAVNSEVTINDLIKFLLKEVENVKKS